MPADIAAHEVLYRWGVVAAILTIVGDTLVAVLFYELFKPVDGVIVRGGDGPSF